MAEGKDKFDKAMDDLLRSAPTKRPDEIKGPARVLKADDLRNFIRGIVESVAGKSQAELLTRISELEMGLQPVKAELDQAKARAAKAESEKEASERRAAEATADARSARDEAAKAAAERDPLQAARDAAETEARRLAEQIRVMDAAGEKAKLAAEIVRLREEIARLEAALECADLNPDPPLAEAAAKVRAALEAVRKGSGAVSVDRAKLAAVGDSLLQGLSDVEAGVKGLRAEVEAARASVSVVVRLAAITNRGDVLHDWARTWERVATAGKG